MVLAISQAQHTMEKQLKLPPLAVAKMDRHTDIYIATLRQHIEALLQTPLDKRQPSQCQFGATLAMQIILDIQHLGAEVLQLEQLSQSRITAQCVLPAGNLTTDPLAHRLAGGMLLQPMPFLLVDLHGHRLQTPEQRQRLRRRDR